MAAKGETFVSVFDRMRRETPSKECYVAYDVTMKRTALTFQEMWTLSARYAHQLKQHGLDRGDYVLVSAPVCLESTVATFGVMLAGGSVVPLEKIYADCLVIREALKASKAKVLIVADDVNPTWDYFKDNAGQVCPHAMSAGYHDDAHALRTVLFCPKSRGTFPVGFIERLRQCDEEFVDWGVTSEDGVLSAVSVNPMAGVPKIVEHSHGSFVDMARKFQKSLGIEKGHYPNMLALLFFFPFDVITGNTRVISDFLEAPISDLVGHFMAVIEREKLSTCLYIPTMLMEMVEATKTKSKAILKEVVTGGMPLTKAFYEKIRSIGETTTFMYGSSEMGAMSCHKLGPNSNFKAFDMGVPFEGVQVRIVDDQHQEVDVGTTGLIQVKSGSMFLKYVGEPGKKAGLTSDDGWFNMSDAGSLGSDGHLYVYGRKSDAISRGIVLISPNWLEQPISSHPDVAEVVVVGVPDPINNYNTCACVVKRPGSKLDDKAIFDQVQMKLTEEGSEYIILDHVVFFDKVLPKMSRDELGRLAAKRLGVGNRNRL